MVETAPIRLHSLVEPVVAAHGLDLVDVELRGEGGGRVLRVFIDKPEGVTLADCEAVSQDLNPLLDVEDPLGGGGYTLEVSSPGLDRKLTRPEDFRRFAGQRVRVRTRTPVGEPGRSNFTGELLGLDAGAVRLRLENRAEAVIQWDNVHEARLAPSWPAPRKPGR